MCKFLIESGADVDEMGEHSGTALSRITGLDRHDTTLVLLENMADPTLSYPGWGNPLSTACSLDIVSNPDIWPNSQSHILTAGICGAILEAR